MINGVTISLLSASTSPVNLGITPDPSNVSAQLQNFVQDFNSLVGSITTDTSFDAANNTGGILLGDATTEQVQNSIYTMINSVVQGVGQFKDLADIGITVNASGDASNGTQLNFDANTFAQAFATDPNAVQNLFSTTSVGLGSVISNAMDSLVDPVNGAITLQVNTLNTQISGYSDQINQLNVILDQKREQLEAEFNQMEETLATLQSQGSLLSSFSGIKTTTANTSAVGSSASS